MATTPNWVHHSAKDLKGRGVCKGRKRAAKARLRALKQRLQVK